MCNPCQIHRTWSYPAAMSGWRKSWKIISLDRAFCKCQNGNKVDHIVTARKRNFNLQIINAQCIKPRRRRRLKCRGRPVPPIHIEREGIFSGCCKFRRDHAVHNVPSGPLLATHCTAAILDAVTITGGSNTSRAENTSCKRVRRSHVTNWEKLYYVNVIINFLDSSS